MLIKHYLCTFSMSESGKYKNYPGAWPIMTGLSVTVLVFNTPQQFLSFGVAGFF